MGVEDKLFTKRKGGLSVYIKRFVKHYYIMLIPALLWLFFFSIVPMFGIVMAFQDYNPGKGILHSEFVGLENFVYMFQMNDVKQVLCNTVVIAVGKIIGNIIIPLLFALLLNELCIKRIKRPIQTIVYLPYFLSWVILAKIVLNIFGYTGPINQLIEAFGGNPINFFGEPSLFQPLVIGTDIWKGFGYNTVVYLAAILGVDQSLYEAAAVDGAGRFKRIWHVTLPGIRQRSHSWRSCHLETCSTQVLIRSTICIIRLFILQVISSTPGYTVQVLRICSTRWRRQSACLSR